MQQVKSSEIEFFDRYNDAAEYNVFSDSSNRLLLKTCVELGGWHQGARIADLGCGSGVFTRLLLSEGFSVFGLDLSSGVMQMGVSTESSPDFIAGDVENLPLASASLDGILLSGIIHHLPDLSKCAAELRRVLKPGGTFVSFDPNRRNPFMWLYRDRSSPLYSSVGVTENERPILAAQTCGIFKEQGFSMQPEYLSGLNYRTVAGSTARLLLPAYNFLDSVLFRPRCLRPYSSFVLLRGEKT